MAPFDRLGRCHQPVNNQVRGSMFQADELISDKIELASDELELTSDELEQVSGGKACA
jgi:hypothetical protein